MTIQQWLAKMPRQRTVRAAKTRTMACGAAAGCGSRPALTRLALRQSASPPSAQCSPAATAIGARKASVERPKISIRSRS